MKDTIRNILALSILGDALGTSLDGLGRSHVHATLKEITGFTDASPALRGVMEKWKKPGLYSSISQLMLLMGLSMKGHTPDLDVFFELIHRAPESQDSPARIFRYPDAVEMSLLAGRTSGESRPVHTMPSARILCIALIPALRSRTMANAVFTVTNVFSASSFDPETAAGGIVMAAVIHALSTGNDVSPQDIYRKCTTAMTECLNILVASPNFLFDAGYNPDAILTSVTRYRDLLQATENIGSLEEAEKIIVNSANSILKTPCTRATINHPLAILPLSIHLIQFYSSTPQDILFRAVEMGGSAAALAAITGAIAGCSFSPDLIPGHLYQEMVNRKNIMHLVETIAAGRMPDSLRDEFLTWESSLTSKAYQEQKAKLKHRKEPDIKNKKPQRSREEELARHVVESWTKTDKARYKKERRKKG